MTKARDLANASTALSAVSATELGYLDGVTSAVQTQIDAKLASSTAATTYVANSLADAKGDLFVASADNTVTRLAVGSTGDTIVADSSTSTGLRYQTAYNGNGSVNGGMDIWQRGTSFTNTNSTSVYAADRWTPYSARTGGTITRQSASLDGFQYCLRFQRDSGNTGTGDFYLMQPLETSESLKYAGQTVTMSFYARAGANYSAASNGLIAQIRTGTGTDQNPWAGYTGSSTIVSQTKTLTTSWQRFTVTGAVGTTATELSLWFAYTPVGTAGAADYFEVTGVQLEIGSVATTFKRAGGTIQGELAACQRYYWRFTAAAGGANYLCLGRTTTQVDVEIQHPVQMRTSPTALEYGGTTDVSNINVAGYNTTSLSFANASVLFASIRANIGQASLAQGATYVFGVQTNAYYGFSAEL